MVEFALDGGLKIPSRAQVGNLSAEIAGEGYKVSEGTKGNWSAPPKQQMYPDWSKIDKIAHYFNRNDFAPWPSWIYHPVETARIVQNAEEAYEYGIIYREPTEDERQMGHGSRYDFIRGSAWRVRPFAKDTKFDHTNPGSGKNYEAPKPDYLRSQHDMMRNLVSALNDGGVKGGGGLDPETIAAIVAATMKAMQPQRGGGDIDMDAPRDWNDPSRGNADNKIHVENEEDRADLISIAEQRGLKVDKRWSTERLKAELSK